MTHPVVVMGQRAPSLRHDVMASTRSSGLSMELRSCPVADKYDAPPYRWALRVAPLYWWALRVAWGGFALLWVCKLRAIDVYSSQSIP